MAEATPGQTVVYQNIPTPEPMNLRCRASLLGFTITNLLIGCVILILAISAVTFGSYVLEGKVLVGVEGSGLWGGAFMLITSAIGVAGILKKNKCQVRAYFILTAIILGFVGTVMFVCAVLWSLFSTASAFYFHHNEKKAHESVAETVAAIEGTMAFLIILYCAFTVVVLCILCINFCTCCGGKQDNPPTVQYVTATNTTSVPSGGHQQSQQYSGGSSKGAMGQAGPGSATPSAPLMEPSPAPPPYEATVNEKGGLYPQV